MLNEQDPKLERAILVGADLGSPSDWPLSESLDELERLADTAGAEVVGRIMQRVARINPRTYIGTGKAEEVASLAKSLDADIVIFDDELTPSQQANLERICRDCKVIDRTALILDIFALHAKTREGRLQVRLAQNQYLLPRLKGMWAHLASNRMGGGVGSRFGEGESQLEVDRRMVRKRITSITRELAKLEQNRETQRKSRAQSGVFRVSLAGYTNAGKSSLINRIAQTDAPVADRLFETLDSLTRKVVLPGGREVTITDTVGFIQKLPHNLVKAFKSTLDEIAEADLILQVTDASSQMRDEQVRAVRDVLSQIGADRIPTIMVYNKCDLLTEAERDNLRSREPGCVLTSALDGSGTEELIRQMELQAMAGNRTMEVLIPFEMGQLVTLAHARCTIYEQEYLPGGTRMSILVPSGFASRFEPYRIPEGI